MTSGEICLICGTNKKITKHHFIERDLNKKGRFRKDGRTIDLCRDCHDDVEALKVKIRWHKRIEQLRKETIKKTLKEVLELIDDIDLKLMFTDIKDTEKNGKLAQSDELMDLFRVFWYHAKKKLKERITEGERT